MTTALVIAEHDQRSIKPATRCAVTAARACAAQVHVLVAGHQAADAAREASRIEGVDKVILADGPALADGLAEPAAAQVLALADGYTHLLFPATSHGKSVAPRVAARLDVAQISDIVRVVAPDTFERPIYAGNAMATVQTRDARVVATVRATSFEPAVDGGAAADVQTTDVVPATGKSSLVSREASQNERPELTAARIVVSGGRALGSAEQFSDCLTPLADALGAAIGASRAAVDAGFAPNDLQVGQTGKIVAPQLYVAIGISGAIQHLAGMKDAKIIVAINKDPDAPIFSVADYGLQADLFEAVPALVQALSASGQER